MSDREFELIKISNAAQEKTTYFLMAASGSGIGFSLSQTKLEALASHHYIWLLAVVIWAISFWAGIRVVMNANNVKLKNATYVGSLNLLKNIEPNEASKLESIAKEKFNDAVGKHQTRMETWGRVQMYGLLLGAVTYVIWHLARMSLQVST